MLVVLAAMPLLSAAVVLAQGWWLAGDNALIALRVHDVLHGHLPMVGQPTTGEQFGRGVSTSHPGPIEFYVLAPFVAALGPVAGMAIGAAVINGSALAGTAWLAFRRGGLGLMVVATIAAMAMASSLEGNLLHDPVSSNVGTFAAVFSLFACWSVLAGDLRVAPLLVVGASFTLQDHLGYLATGAPVVAVTLVVGAWWVVRLRRRVADSSWVTRTLGAGATLAAFLWLPVLIDEQWGSHNLTAIVRTFTGSRTVGEGSAFGLERLGVSLAPPLPTFARQVGPLGHLHQGPWHELALGALVVVVVVALGGRAAHRRDASRAAMAVVALVAAGAGAWSAAKVPVGAAIQASNLRWMWTVSAFVWVTLAWLAWELVPPIWRGVVHAPGVLAAVLSLVIVGAGTVQTIGLDTDRDGQVIPELRTLASTVEHEVPVGTFRVRFGGESAAALAGPAIVRHLDAHGITVLMDTGPFDRAYGAHRSYTGQRIDGTLRIVSGADPGAGARGRLVAEQPLPVGRGDLPVGPVRVYLEAADS